MGVLKHFVSWDIWSGGIETFCLFGYWNILSLKNLKILSYIKSISIIFILSLFKYLEYFVPRNIFSLGVLKHFKPKIYKDFKLYQVFMYSFYIKLIQIFWNILTKNSDTVFFPKMFQYTHIGYYSRTLLQPFSKNWFYFFFLIFWNAKTPPSFRIPCYCY